MGNYTGTATFQENVYQFETTDPVQGGTDGVSNLPLKQLADRTVFLKKNNVGEVAAFATSSPPTGWLKANGARVLRASYTDLFAAVGMRFGQRFTILSFPGTASSFISITRESENTPATTESHGFSTGDEVRIENFGEQTGYSALFGGTPITNATSCFVRNISATVFSLHPTSLDATNDTNAASITLPTGAYMVVEYADSFSLPDLRGEFIRGWDDGLGVDAGRLLGSSQLDDFKSHIHNFVGFGGNSSTQAVLDTGGPTTGNLEITGGVNTNYLSNGQIQSSGGSETRPRNVALLYCIKFG